MKCKRHIIKECTRMFLRKDEIRDINKNVDVSLKCQTSLEFDLLLHSGTMSKYKVSLIGEN